MPGVFGGDPVADQVAAALAALESGEAVPERTHYDFKEEAGRRQRDGTVLPGSVRNDAAAESLAGEVACMCNTPGGGALIVGVSDDRSVIGTQLGIDWLQRRLYELLGRKISVVVTEQMVCGQRVLVIRCPPAVEPISYRKRARWRVGDQCVDIDPPAWFRLRAEAAGYDWSDQPGGVPVDRVRAEAMAIARKFLRDSGDDRSEDLARVPDRDFLRRLGLVMHDDELTTAGALLLVGRTSPGLDYIRRPYPGADSEDRVNAPGVSLLEELDAVFTVARAYNPEVHLPQGLVIARRRQLPERAIREAIVNGVAHRLWIDPAPTTVEHIGATLRVTSPGGFVGGVDSDNIINHPSTSRNAALTRILAVLHVAERQGIGVDRMFVDMLRMGHPQPEIVELDGARVLTVLTGAQPDMGWVAWLAEIGDLASTDLRILMTLHRLVRRWWTDEADLAPYLQVTRSEAEQVRRQVAVLQLDGGPVVTEVAGVPDERGVTVVALAPEARERLRELRAAAGVAPRDPARHAIALAYAEHAGRISTTELGGIVGASPTNMGAVLRELEHEGAVEPSRANRRGPGFYYRFVPGAE